MEIDKHIPEGQNPKDDPSVQQNFLNPFVFHVCAFYTLPFRQTAAWSASDRIYNPCVFFLSCKLYKSARLRLPLLFTQLCYISCG
jgi:hypothetical protein